MCLGFFFRFVAGLFGDVVLPDMDFLNTGRSHSEVHAVDDCKSALWQTLNQENQT